MPVSTPFPWTGFAIAIFGCVILMLTGTGIGTATVVLLLWTGSLWLITASPPPSYDFDKGPEFSPDRVGDLIEHSATPLLIQERGRITVANLAARRALGSHVIGQETRVTFRQPEAVRLMNTKGSGSAIIRGLTRRKDIWRVSKQVLRGDMAVIELTNRTAEADMTRAHTDFVANASHELRTPLSSIIGYVETLQESGQSVEPKMAEKFLGTVLHEAHRLRDLITDLMSLSRIEAEKHDQPDALVHLPQLVERAARDAAGARRSERLNLSLGHTKAVRGDTQQLEQLVRNLIDNALKYSPDDALVDVHLGDTENDSVQLRVTDHGDGIDQEHLPHLTRRFYRTDPGRSRASGGTGLGLAIVKHITERHRGRLDIDSTLREGTSVTVRFPAVGDDG